MMDPIEVLEEVISRATRLVLSHKDEIGKGNLLRVAIDNQWRIYSDPSCYKLWIYREGDMPPVLMVVHGDFLKWLNNMQVCFGREGTLQAPILWEPIFFKPI